MILGLGRDRKRERERRAFADTRLYPDLSPLGLDQTHRDVKPQPKPVVLLAGLVGPVAPLEQNGSWVTGAGNCYPVPEPCLGVLMRARILQPQPEAELHTAPTRWVPRERETWEETMPQQRVLNGVDVEKLKGAMDTMRSDPEAAKLRHRAHNKWVDGAHARTVITGFSLGGQEHSRARAFALDSDEPAPLLGEDHGPSATEALLYALASCLNTTFIYHASARGVKVDELEIDLEGELDLRGLLDLSDQVRNGYQQIRATFRVRADAPREQIEELVEMAQKHSPVFDMVTHATPVSAALELESRSTEEAA